MVLENVLDFKGPTKIFRVLFHCLVASMAPTFCAFAQQELTPEMIDAHVYRQDKTIDLPVVNKRMFTSVKAITVCVPDSIGAAHDEGIEATCEVKFQVDRDGVPSVTSTVCNGAYHRDFVSEANDPRHIAIVERWYRSLLQKSIEESRFAISSEFEAHSLGTLAQRYDFLIRDYDDGQRYELIPIDGPENSTSYDAHELVDDPKSRD